MGTCSQVNVYDLEFIHWIRVFVPWLCTKNRLQEAWQGSLSIAILGLPYSCWFWPQPEWSLGGVHWKQASASRWTNLSGGSWMGYTVQGPKGCLGWGREWREMLKAIVHPGVPQSSSDCAQDVGGHFPFKLLLMAQDWAVFSGFCPFLRGFLICRRKGPQPT